MFSAALIAAVLGALLSPTVALAQNPVGSSGTTTTVAPPVATEPTTLPSTPTTAAPQKPSAPGATSSTTVPDTSPVDDFRDPGGTTIPPTRREQLVPPPIDLTSLNQLLGTRRAAAVEQATGITDAANSEALSLVADQKSALAKLNAQVPALDAAVADARAGERDATAELERARARKADLAVESYTLALSGSSATMDAAADLLADSDGYENFVRTTQYSGAAWSSLERGVGVAERSLAQAEAATQAAIDTRKHLERRIGAAQSAVDASVSNAEQVAAEGENRIAVANAIGDDLSVAGLGPTIMGETLLSPEDLAAFSARRSGAAPSVDLLELARLFVLEGTAEGVRADIAWAQSILETGNFGYRGSMVATSDNNYAGIGACDSCSGGFRYGTPQMGVRAQVQLLHTYADDNLTASDLAFPPAGKPPESSSVRGCCDTWMELSGVWATGPGYGVKILTIYNDMLAFAAERQREAQKWAALAPDGPDQAPAVPTPAAVPAPVPAGEPG